MKEFIIIITLTIGFTVSQDNLDRPVILKHPNDTYTLLGKTVELSCEADGNPYPEVKWYKDNSPVITHKDRPVTARITAQNGQLIIHDFQEDLQGSYYCNATNAFGSTASNSAIVKLAFISDAISASSDVSVSIGETISLECIPPSGLPIPQVHWESSEHGIIIPDGRISLTPAGNLIILNADRSDSAKYYCVAENMAGKRVSHPSNLQVLRKPQFLITPMDETVSLGGSVSFRCQVEGDPEPTIVWSRRDSQSISHSRSHILADKSLRIDQVQQADAGEYICATKNSALEASARLHVKESPNFVQTPNDQVTVVGEQVTFSCVVKGEPKPNIRWVINGRQYLTPTNGQEENLGRYTFIPTGSLRINNVDKSDEGSYECRASQEAGTVKSTAKLTIIDPNAKPIPIIEIGPQDVNVTLDKSVTLNCKGRVLDTNRLTQNAFISEDSGASDIDYRLYTKWYIANVPFNPSTNSRIVILSPETLQINAFDAEDQGTYECRLYFANDNSDQGIYASARANLILRSDNDRHPFYESSSDLIRNLPEPPKSIDVAFIGDTWINLSWDVPVQPSEFPITGYRVEYIEYKGSNRWVIAHYNIPITRNVTIAGLKPERGYLFSVRSINRAGYGRPMLSSKFAFTTKEIQIKSLNHDQINSLASSINISPVVAKPVSKSEVQLSWNVCSSKKMLELISSFEVVYHPRPISECIRYRPFMPGLCSAPQMQDALFDKNKYCSLSRYHEFDDKALSEPIFSLSRVQDYNLKIDIKADLNSEEPRVTTVVENLYPFVCYIFEVKALLNVGSAKSANSQSNPVLTFESIPSEAPDNLRANWKSNGTVLQVDWNHLNPPYTNGILSEYTLRFINNKTQKFDKQIITSDQTTYFLEETQSDTSYTIHVAASTCNGEGIRSSPLRMPSWDMVFAENSRTNNPFAFLYSSDWPMFLWLLIAGCGIVFFSTFLLFIIFCYKRKSKRDGCFGDGAGRKMKKSSKFQHLPDNPMNLHDVKNFTNFTQNHEKNLLLMGNNFMMYDQKSGQNPGPHPGQNSFAQNSTSPMALNKFSPTSNGNYFPLAPNTKNTISQQQNNSSSNSNNLYTNQMTMDSSYADPSLMSSVVPAGKFPIVNGNNSGQQSMMQFGLNSSGNSNTSRSHGSNPMLIQGHGHGASYPNQTQYRHDLDDTASPYASTSVVNGPHDTGVGAGEEEFPGSNTNQLRLAMSTGQQGPQLHIPPPPDSPPPPVPHQNAAYVVNNSQATVNSSINSKTATTNTSNSSHGSLNNNNTHSDLSRFPTNQNVQHNVNNGNFMMTNQHHHQSSFHSNNLDSSSHLKTPSTNCSSHQNQSPYAVYQS